MLEVTVTKIDVYIMLLPQFARSDLELFNP